MKDKEFIIERFKSWDYGYKSLDCFELSDRRFIVRLETRGFRLTSIPHLVGFDIEDIYVRPQSVPSSYGYLYVSIHFVKV